MRGMFSRELHRNQAGYRSTAIANRTQPPRYKIFLLTWLAIYPLITSIFLMFGSLLAALPLLLRTLLLTGVLVYLMTYLVMPKLMKVFHRWLYLN
jgi:antibiotic biosynthesis monooxygenase (ABM) superfamily enzyme